MAGNLFNKIYLQDFIHQYKENLQKSIDKYEITESTDIDSLVEILKKSAKIEPIEILDPEPSEPKETSRRVEDPIYRETYNQKVFEIFVRIPFSGNSELFFCRPSTSQIVYLDLAFTINSTAVIGKIVLAELDPIAYNNEIESIIKTLNSNLPTINAEVAAWNNSLDMQIRNSLEKRKVIISKKHEFMEKIGLKVNQKSEEFLTPPTVRKKVIPNPKSETAKAIIKETIPILQESVYTDIKEVLYNVGAAMERKPSLYKGKHEEDLRDIFLLFLETRYESATGVGEAFNKKGKTDILLKYAKDGSNLFVAECKIWKGQKKMMEAVDQLLGYLTHRDSKTALMFFVDQKELSSIIDTIKTDISSHPNHIRYLKDSHETSLTYEFSLPEDSKKIIHVEIMLFHFPK
ncbi:hypothetical protein [Sphingobacterium sp.]|uniref:hypothetical protein n=1 Tax=Sphingobacterium sp. TaxID=341027 RepID=UPI00289FDE1A|nr:hypothetical protein [Sphingobacterium sp.]